MVLPLIPIAMAGCALAAGLFGVKKGVDAKTDFDRAEAINREARAIIETAQAELEPVKQDAHAAFERLGHLKLEVWSTELRRFGELLDQMVSDGHSDDNRHFSHEAVLELKHRSLQAGDLLAGGLAGLGTGALASIGALGGAALFGTASTGTAIGALGGVAATNATLAWLGGGAMAAGGMGMAGGAAVLGGVIAGPLLAAGGMFLASKAEESVANARANLEKADDARTQLASAREQLIAFQTGAEALGEALLRVRRRFNDQLDALAALIQVHGKDASRYEPAAQAHYHRTSLTARVLRDWLTLNLMHEDGTFDAGVYDALAHGERQLLDAEENLTGRIPRYQEDELQPHF